MMVDMGMTSYEVAKFQKMSLTVRTALRKSERDVEGSDVVFAD